MRIVSGRRAGRPVLLRLTRCTGRMSLAGGVGPRGNPVASDLTREADLIIAADGLNSRLRQKYAATYQPDIDLRNCRFVWLGTKKL